MFFTTASFVQYEHSDIAKTSNASERAFLTKPQLQACPDETPDHPLAKTDGPNTCHVHLDVFHETDIDLRIEEKIDRGLLGMTMQDDAQTQKMEGADQGTWYILIEETDGRLHQVVEVNWIGTEDTTEQGETFQQFLERRRDIREKSNVTFWPASPDARPPRDASPSPSRKSKKSRRRERSTSSVRRKSSKRRDDSVSDSESGSESDVSTSKAHRKRSSSSKRSSRKSKSEQKHKKKSSKKKRARTPTPSSSSASESASDSEREVARVDNKQASPPPVDETVQDYWREKAVEPVDDAPVGPMPLNVAEAKHDERAYGGALLAGEGSAMAAYLQSGKRIPRRGEIGLTSNEIEKYEDVGFVMSGNRHRRMNAVRIRKENQVISAEEKRALLLFNQEANLKKEAEIIANFKDMVTAKMRGKDDVGTDE
ncbi:hypothetical protein PhCBS80983_g01457 [Powellomyces hirtus]|uniref:NF-kappa-B-activating protein C-terminal domain-containing protein n=1 Tax=Powellomyces hirtus TaxID=109895 RepID=A0A507ECP9_9FUNG|nr:hypothetical protein PhCBS80983_g01457 [Powellomyces hirtus]